MLLCFLVASTFWVLNSLNKNYNGVRVSYPVVFIYDKQKLIPVTEPPKEVVVNVTGKGWKLLRKTLNLRIRPARIDLTARSRRNFLTARELRPHINAALNGLVLNYVVTDTIYFNFERLTKRQLRLEVDSTQNLVAENHVLTGKPRFTPATITVTGPESRINALPDPYPVYIPDSSLTENYRNQVTLPFVPEDLIRPNVTSVGVQINVTALQQIAALVPISVVNKTNLNDQLQVDPGQVRVNFFAHPNATRVDTTAFRIEADLNRINPQDSTIQLKLTSMPRQIKRVLFSPDRVKVIYPMPRR